MTHWHCHVWCLHQSVDSVVYCKCYTLYITIHIYLVISIPITSTFFNDLIFNIEYTMMTIIDIKLKTHLNEYSYKLKIVIISYLSIYLFMLKLYSLMDMKKLEK